MGHTPSWEAWLIAGGGVSVAIGLYVLGRAIGGLTQAVRDIEGRVAALERVIKLDHPRRRRRWWE